MLLRPSGMSSSIDQQSRSPDPQATDADSAAVGAAAAARSIAGQQPDLADVLALESRVRRQGTGLQVEDLLGLWRPERIWPRAGRRGSALTEALLRGLSASLRIEPSAPAMAAGSGGCGEDGGPGDGLWLSNAVRLGPFALRFQGPGKIGRAHV